MSEPCDVWVWHACMLAGGHKVCSRCQHDCVPSLASAIVPGGNWLGPRPGQLYRLLLHMMHRMVLLDKDLLSAIVRTASHQHATHL